MMRTGVCCTGIAVLLGSVVPPSFALPSPSLESRRIATAAPISPAAAAQPPALSYAPFDGTPNWTELNQVRRIIPDAVPAPGNLRGDGSGVRVLISIPQQKAYVFLNGALFGTSAVSTGKRGHATPVGSFPILQKKVHHRSSKYDNAPMPFMQRLTHYGIALHAGRVPGYPASHGCIRFPRGFAKKLYGITDYGTRVTITNARPQSSHEALRLA